MVTEGEHAELASVDRAVEGVIDRFKHKDLGSAEFQAFADYADNTDAETDLRRIPDNVLFQFRYCLINEAIRQKENGVMGYKSAFKQAVELGNGISAAEEAKRNRGGSATELRTHLGFIKNTIIRTKADQT